MTQKVSIILAFVFSFGTSSHAMAQDVWGQAKSFSEAELAMSGLKIARSMVEADCKGRVFWAGVSVGKSGYAASYNQLRAEGYDKKEMRRASKHRTMAVQAFGMWLKEAGINFSAGEISTEQLCAYVEEISGSNHPIGRFLVKE
ncbi:hypothetical protein [Ruegeria arenilitoris]|uniref:hypothetical protein n=1 Tax=Ruegeria arenilitoris TaxID=1173585 RepID=UPI001CFD3F6C|nr:hypothetical protein [Ruegeria arenilitoris]